MPDRLQTYLKMLKKATSTVQENIQERVALNGNQKMSGTEFELVVRDALLKSGLSETQLTHSPQKFPDFIITDTETGLRIGVEVKKTDSDKWEVIGGSIYESLKNDIDDTFILMGKFGGSKPEARFKRYEECLQDLKVTHSPRFYLNLDIPEGEDYLTRNETEDLLELRGEELNRKIRKLLRSNKSTWWSEEETVAYTDLSPEEKEQYLNYGVALFPEVFGSDYTNFTPWMIYSCLVWCGNVRDIFSAGGVALYNGIYFSAVMNRTIVNIESIRERIEIMSHEELVKYWHSDVNEVNERIDTWINLIEMNLKLSNSLIKKNQKLECFEGMEPVEIEESIKREFIKILRKLCGSE